MFFLGQRSLLAALLTAGIAAAMPFRKSPTSIPDTDLGDAQVQPCGQLEDFPLRLVEPAPVFCNTDQTQSQILVEKIEPTVEPPKQQQTDSVCDTLIWHNQPPPHLAAHYESGIQPIIERVAKTNDAYSELVRFNPTDLVPGLPAKAESGLATTSQ